MHTCVLVADDRNIYEILDPFANYDGDSAKPQAKWDYFGVGGRFEGRLPLKQPRTVRRFFGLIPVGRTKRASVARKSEIDQEAFLANPPAAIFFRDKLHECPLTNDAELIDKWDVEFRERFAEIPDDTVLQIVDAHS